MFDAIAKKIGVEKRIHEYKCQYYWDFILRACFFFCVLAISIFLNTIWYFMFNENSLNNIMALSVAIFINIFTLGVISKTFRDNAAKCILFIIPYVQLLLEKIIIKPMDVIYNFKDKMMKRYCSRIN